jgi:RNA polymerase sigma-70 factor (ECF subfamily)
MPQTAFNYETMSDLELASQAAQRNALAIRLITTRNNQRLFRAAWSVVKNHADAEDIVQDAYMKAFTAMETYTGKSSLSTWLTRIVINKAIDRQRQAKRRDIDLLKQGATLLEAHRSPGSSPVALSPEAELGRKELSRQLKDAIARLPDDFRVVFVLREIEDMSGRDTATILDLKEATVKSRLHRARRMLREDLEPEFRNIMSETIVFAGADCDAMTERVLIALDI